jgi:hypothetical protein
MDTRVESHPARERALADHVARLSRRLRAVEACLAGLMVAVAAALGTNLLNASARTEQVVRARSFVVTDEEGRVRAELGLTGEIAMDGSHGEAVTPRRSIVPALRMFDGEGHDMLSMGLAGDGTADLRASDDTTSFRFEAGRDAASAQLSSDARSVLMQVTAKGSELIVRAEGREVLRMPLAPGK